MKFIRERVSDESGQSIVEYGLLISLVMLATLAVAAGCHNSIAGIANTAGSNLTAGEMLTSKAIKRALPKIETSVTAHVSLNEEFSHKVVAKSINQGIETGGRPSGNGRFGRRIRADRDGSDPVEGLKHR